tara:strand:+ start:2020 stop:2760 length:741 start_codon:yes stop_codon:yes gene_type:complete
MLNILSSTAYFTLNKHLVKFVGVESALVLSDLISKEDYFINNNLIKDGYFFNTLDNIEQDTTLSAHKIRNALKRLKKVEFIEIKLKGIPAKTHIKIMHNKLLKFLTTSDAKFKPLTNNNKTNTNVLVNKNKVKRFTPPPLQDIIDFFKDNNSNDNEAQKYNDFYTSKGWLVGKAKMKDWKAAGRNWIRRNKEEDNNSSNGMPNYYNAKYERLLQGDEVMQYHRHLRGLGWRCVHSPTAGSIWKKPI